MPRQKAGNNALAFFFNIAAILLGLISYGLFCMGNTQRLRCILSIHIRIVKD